MNESEEKKLVSSIILGDEKAFERLFEIFHPIVYSVAHSIIGISDEVDDAVQEIFMKILSGIIHFRFNSRLSTWIYSIARNHSINYKNRKSREAVSLEDINKTPPASEVSAEQSLIKREISYLVKDSLQSLKDEYRIALELRYMAEKSYEEISEIMDVPTGTVKTYIHRAKNKLREKILERKELE